MVSAPVWARSLLVGVLFTAALLYAPGMGHRWYPGAIVGGLAFGAFMGLFLAVIRRRDVCSAGGAAVSHAVGLDRAIRTGKVPTDQELDQPVLALVQRRRRQNKWAGRLGLWFLGGIGALGVIVAITERDVSSWLYVLVDLGIVLCVRWAAARNLVRLERLEMAIRECLSQ
jgi:hypothetical protein